MNKIGGDSWKNAKFIITCREEYLNDEKDKELLYEFRNDKSNDSLPYSRRFMRRKIEPFTNEQIACFLKKYWFVHQISTFGESKFTPSSPSNSECDSGLTKSWRLVREFEKLVDEHELKEMARIPFILWIMMNTLQDIVTQGIRINFDKSGKLTNRFLIDFFVDKVVKSAIQRPALASPHVESEFPE